MGKKNYLYIESKVKERTEHRDKYCLTEEGSVTVMVALLIPIMLLMVMLIANIGQLVLAKIRLQNTVDAAALAAATVQSAGLNEIADLNNELDLEYNKLQYSRLKPGIWFNEYSAQTTVDFFRKVFGSIHSYQEAANRYYARKAIRAAEEVTSINLPGSRLETLNRNTRLMNFNYKKEKASYYYYFLNCLVCPLLPAKLWFDPDTPSTIGPHDGVLQIVARRTVPLPGEESVNVRMRKVGRTTYSVFKLSQRPGGFMLGSSIFPLMPELTTYAAAKPSGGNIYYKRPYYRPVMVQLKSLSPPGVPDIAMFEH